MKTFGKPFTRCGVEYLHTMVWYKRPAFKLLSGVQWCLWKVGFNWHMKMFGGQCTPDFSCCN
jgi:energy-converting hydrogenase Eha subunit G